MRSSAVEVHTARSTLLAAAKVLIYSSNSIYTMATTSEFLNGFISVELIKLLFHPVNLVVFALSLAVLVFARLVS